MRERRAWRRASSTRDEGPQPKVEGPRPHTEGERYRWLAAQLVLAVLAVAAFGAAAAGSSAAGLVEESPRPAEATWKALRVGYVPRAVLGLELQARDEGTDVAIEANGAHGTVVIDGGPSRLVGLKFNVLGPTGSETLVLRASDGAQWTVWADGQPRAVSSGSPPGTVRVPVGSYQLLGWSRDGMAKDLTLNVAVVEFKDRPVVLQGDDAGKIGAMTLGTAALGLAGALRWSPSARAQVRRCTEKLGSLRRRRSQFLDSDAGDG